MQKNHASVNEQNGGVGNFRIPAHSSLQWRKRERKQNFMLCFLSGTFDATDCIKTIYYKFFGRIDVFGGKCLTGSA